MPFVFKKDLGAILSPFRVLRVARRKVTQMLFISAALAKAVLLFHVGGLPLPFLSATTSLFPLQLAACPVSTSTNTLDKCRTHASTHYRWKFSDRAW